MDLVVIIDRKVGMPCAARQRNAPHFRHAVEHRVEGLSAAGHFNGHVNAAVRNLADTLGEIRVVGIKGVIGSISGDQTTGLLLAIVLIPLVFGFVSYLLYQKFYKLDEKTYQDICSQLDQKA